MLNSRLQQRTTLQAKWTALATAGCLASCLSPLTHAETPSSALSMKKPLSVEKTLSKEKPVSEKRIDELRYLVIQDCGSCHGMRLKGGLGPALLPSAIAHQDVDSLSATIIYGRPTTAMPPWKGILSLSDARWIAEQLKAGGFTSEHE